MSNKIPINSITCDGPCVFPLAMGMLIVWKVDNMLVILKGYCVLVRVKIIHNSKFLPRTVEKNS